MFLAGIIMVAIGTAGIFTAIGMEIKTHEPIWNILMKGFPWLVGIGLVLISMGY